MTSAQEQLRILEETSVRCDDEHDGRFDAVLGCSGWERLDPVRVEIFQMNLGRLCNMRCRHCHVDAGPHRGNEVMSRETIDQCLRALDATDAATVDLTGGAPELNPHFRYLVDRLVERGKHVIDRCNLTVLHVPQAAGLPSWFAERGVEVVASLPHFRKRNTDAQRGEGTFERSIEAIGWLNEAGYGQGDPDRVLTIMTNPAGAFLAGDQAAMEAEWKRILDRDHGVRFDRLIALNNMPIARFLDWLIASDNLDDYMCRLIRGYNPGAVTGLMCRNTISISWDGRIFDCDFNQMLDLEADVPGSSHVAGFDPDAFARRRIRTDRHCFGCTAGQGSSCGGSTAR